MASGLLVEYCPLLFAEVSPFVQAVRWEGEQAGDKTFGVICQRERVFPKSLAKPRSGGETPSRATPSCPALRSHAHQASDPSP